MIGNSQMRFAPDFIAEYAQMYPTIRFNMISPPDVEEFKAGKADLINLSGQAALTDCVELPRGKMIFVPVASPAYLERHGAVEHPSELAHHRVFSTLYPHRFDFVVRYPLVKNGLTLTSPDEEVRRFWIEHGKACIRISQYFAEETGIPCVMNIWIGDGFKDVPADRMGPRERYKDSIEQILSEPFDRSMVKPCVESKVFGIGVEAYTAGSAEFTLMFAATHEGCLPLMDNGHYHPTEVVSDKIPALLCYFPEIALHITRGIRWDSDHVLVFDDETKEMAKEIVRCNALDRVYMALDYFDASINRIAAWAVGFRSWQKALLNALLLPNEKLKALQDSGNYTELLVMQEAVKTLPFEAVWNEYCARYGLDGGYGWFDEVKKYEAEVLSKRV